MQLMVQLNVFWGRAAVGACVLGCLAGEGATQAQTQTPGTPAEHRRVPASAPAAAGSVASTSDRGMEAWPVPRDPRAAFDLQLRLALTALDQAFYRIKSVVDNAPPEETPDLTYFSLAQAARNRSVSALRQQHYAAAFREFAEARSHLQQAVARLSQRFAQASALMRYLEAQQQAQASETAAPRMDPHMQDWQTRTGEASSPSRTSPPSSASKRQRETARR